MKHASSFCDYCTVMHCVFDIATQAASQAPAPRASASSPQLMEARSLAPIMSVELFVSSLSLSRRSVVDALSR